MVEAGTKRENMACAPTLKTLVALEKAMAMPRQDVHDLRRRPQQPQCLSDWQGTLRFSMTARPRLKA